MWPLSGEAFANALGSAIATAHAGVTIERVLVGLERTPAAGDALVVVEPSLYPHVGRILRAGAEVAVVSTQWTGISELSAEMRARCILVERPLAAFRRLAGSMRRTFSFPVIAVGGCNGKTTTKEMIAAVLGGPGRAITKTPGTNNGWVGTPIALCDRAHRRDAPPDALVLEIGIDEVSAMESHVRIAAPDLAVISALGAEHLNGLKSVAIAVAEEMKLFAAPRRIWLADDPHLRARLDQATAGDVIVHDARDPVIAAGDTVSFAWRAQGADRGALDLVLRRAGDDVGRLAVDVPLPGRHHGTNAALAFATGFALGRSPAAMAEAFRSFVPPPQRTAITPLENGGVVIDDTYNASPSSMRAALAIVREFPHETKLLVLGDMLDLGSATDAEHAALAASLTSLAADLDAKGEALHLRLHGSAMEVVARTIGRAHVRSVTWQGEGGDPAALIDRDSHGTCILIKGSRGMRMERAVARAVGLGREAWDASVVAIAVVGNGSHGVARALREIAPPHVRVRALDEETIARGALTRATFRVAVFTGLPHGVVDKERALAVCAQPFVNLPPGGAAIVAQESNEDAAAALIAEVVAPAASIVRVAPIALVSAVSGAISSITRS